MKRPKTEVDKFLDEALESEELKEEYNKYSGICKIEQIGEEDTVINHRLFRSGEGEYRMNGKVVRLKDIQDHLWKRAIGETEYFVIEQGNIGIFLSSKPQEKRVLLEEAAGTAFYKEKKRQAQRKLENSELNLARLEDIIVEVERAKNALKRQASAAIRYRQLRERIRELTLYQFRTKIHNLEGEQRETVQSYQKSMIFVVKLKLGG